MGADKRLTNWIIVIIVLLIALGIPYLKVQRGEPAIRQGIDLVGGVDMLLQASPPEGQPVVTPDMLKGAIQIIRNRIDPEGVKEIVLQQLGVDRIVLQVPGEDNPERIKQLLGSTATLRFINAGAKSIPDGTKLRFVDANGAPVPIPGMPETEQPSVVPAEPMVLTPSDVLYKPEDMVGFEAAPATAAPAGSEPAIANGGSDIALRLNQGAGVKLAADSTRLKGDYILLVIDNKLVASTVIIDALTHSIIVFKGLGADPNFKMTELNADLSRVKIVNGGTETPIIGREVDVWDPSSGQAAPNVAPTASRIDVKTEQIILTGSDFAKADVTFGRMNEPIIAFEFKPYAAQIFGRYTAQHVKQFLAISLDDTIISCPVIREPIMGGKGVIEGKFQLQEAQDLVVKLNSGSLPVTLRVIQNNSIGPMLGTKSINESKKAAIAGLILVVLFMLIYYRFPGFMADLSLLFYMAVVFGAMSLLNATLTLPGIAGFVMSIGMAVDANVIIFERLREELRAGKTFRAAIDAGFKRAFPAVFDSHMTSIMSGIVLYNLGTGPIRGFAVTLTLGCLTSLFSAITVTRILLETAMDNTDFQTYGMFGVKAPQGIAKPKGGDQ